MVEKLNISAIHNSIILILFTNIPLVFIYKFYKTENQIQPPGNPWEQHLGDVWQGRLKL